MHTVVTTKDESPSCLQKEEKDILFYMLRGGDGSGVLIHEFRDCMNQCC